MLKFSRTYNIETSYTTHPASTVFVGSLALIELAIRACTTFQNRCILLHTQNMLMVMMGKDRSGQHDYADYH